MKITKTYVSCHHLAIDFPQNQLALDSQLPPPDFPIVSSLAEGDLRNPESSGLSRVATNDTRRSEFFLGVWMSSKLGFCDEIRCGWKMWTKNTLPSGGENGDEFHPMGSKKLKKSQGVLSICGERTRTQGILEIV